MNEQEEQKVVPRTGRVLKKMAVSFVVLTALLAVVVGYTAFSTARVMVTLGAVDKEYSFNLKLAEDVFGRARPSGALTALFLETTEGAADTFTPTGSGERVGKAGGTVTIHNETGRDQSLVTTTRLLSSDGILFRLKEGVRVPANGKVAAVVEADKDGKEGEIGPTRFTIPGLSISLQSVIYAVSDAEMARGGALSKIVTEQDLETARQTLRQKILDDTRQSFAAQVGDNKLMPSDYITTVIEEKASVKAGEAVSSFTMEAKTKIIGVVFDKTEMLMRIAEETGDQRNVVAADKVRYTLGNFNTTDRTASLGGRATIQSSIDRQSSIFAADNFTGLTIDGVKNFLSKYEGIKNVEVKISPYWQKHLPRIPSRIRVEFREG